MIPMFGFRQVIACNPMIRFSPKREYVGISEPTREDQGNSRVPDVLITRQGDPERGTTENEERAFCLEEYLELRSVQTGE